MIIAEWQSVWLQQMRTSPNAAATDTKMKEKSCLPLEGLRQIEGVSNKKCSHLHCQPLNEGWEGLDPGSTPHCQSGTLPAPELPQVGPAFSPGAQSLVQAMTQHFHYSKGCFRYFCLLCCHCSRNILLTFRLFLLNLHPYKNNRLQISWKILCPQFLLSSSQTTVRKTFKTIESKFIDKSHR